MQVKESGFSLADFSARGFRLESKSPNLPVSPDTQAPNCKSVVLQSCKEQGNPTNKNATNRETIIALVRLPATHSRWHHHGAGTNSSSISKKVFISAIVTRATSRVSSLTTFVDLGLRIVHSLATSGPLCANSHRKNPSKARGLRM